MTALRHFLLAVQFFTRIPITGRLADWVGYSPSRLRASAGHFPGVGWLVGAAAAVVYALLHFALGTQAFVPLIAAVGCTMASALVTGGFHEDGLADVADGLGGSLQRERALEIMKDSRIGAFGALALMLVLAAKLSLIALIGSAGLQVVVPVLVGAHVLSRFWPLLLVRGLRHVGDTATSKSKPLADRIAASSLATAALWCTPAMAAIAYVLGASFLWATLLGSALAAAWMGRWFSRRLQGFTGDCLGATQQMCELAFYFCAAIALAQSGI